MINISCHALFQVHKTGPKLHNIFGKKAGQQKGFLKYYSPGNRNFGH
jgi:cytochrome c2